MRCQSCGAVIEDNTSFCPICGARQDLSLQKLEKRYGSDPGAADPAESYYPDDTVYGMSDVGERYSRAFREPLFLAVTILMTVAAALSIFSFKGTDMGVEFNMGAAIPILYAVALWMIYGEFRADKRQYSTTGLAIASGTTKAVFIINWVAVGLVAVLMVITILFGHLLVNYLTIPFIEDFPDIIEIPGVLGAAYRPGQTNPGHSVPGLDTALVLTIAVIGVVLIALLIVLNLCFYKKLHRFTKSLCVSLKNDYLQIERTRPVKAWLIVFAVFCFIGAAGSVSLSVIESIALICQGLASIFASVLIGRHFPEQSY